MSGLRELWGDVIPDAGPLADTLVRRYAGKRRAYRDDYLRRVLEALDSLEQLATDPVAVRLAAWFHRAVHTEENTAQEDAEASAQLAEELLPTYGVTEVRTAEVARLVRLTGDGGPNGDVLQDAVNAVLADPQYAKHASEVRRDSRFDAKLRQEQLRAMLAADRIYRTDLAHERYEQAARENLTAELERLDETVPDTWRGWQRGGLVVLAVVVALVAFLAALASINEPWRYPEFNGDPHWQAILMAGLAAVSVGAVWWAVRRTGRTARLVLAGPVVIGVVGTVVVLLTVPPSSAGSGPGLRVPLLLVTSIFLVLAGVAAFVADRFPRGVTRNRGQVLAGLGSVVVVVLVTLLVLAPVAQAYVRGADEYLDDRHVAAGSAETSVVDGGTLWTSPGGGYSLWSVVGTPHGIAIARGEGAVEMIDPKTGKTRWRYLRADSGDNEPKLHAIDGGRQLLVSFDNVGYVVLDSDTGKRTATWPDAARDDDVDVPDPLVTSRSVSKGSDKWFGTEAGGSHRWTYEPGRCTSTSATSTADTVVLTVGESCHETPSQLVGIDLKSGKKLWSHDGNLADMTPAGDLVVGLRYTYPVGTGPTPSSGQMIAIDARSGQTRWSMDLPNEWGCNLRLMAAGNHLVLLTCPTKAQTSTVAHFVDPAAGRMVSTATAAGAGNHAAAVTTDGRLFILSPQGESRCRIVQLSAGAAPKNAPLDESIGCGWGVAAAGNLILVSSREALIALR